MQQEMLIRGLPNDSPEETGLKKLEQVPEKNAKYPDSIQLVVSIPKSIYEYLQQKNLSVTRIFQESLVTAMLLSQNQDSLEEFKVEINVDPDLR